MSKPRIIYVPGKNPKPPPIQHQSQLWRCLLHGVASVDPIAAKQMSDEPQVFTLAAWNHSYYGRDQELTSDLPWIDRLLQTRSASESDQREVRSWSSFMTKLMYALGDRFHFLIRLIPDPRIKAMIQDTAPYFDNVNDVACVVREIVKQPLRTAMFNDERVLLIGHSMGSVIAYDALYELSHLENMHHKIELFLTMGSPLGMRYVQSHLLGWQRSPKSYPYTINQWKNVSALGDLVSVDQTISDDFAEMTEAGALELAEDYCRGIYNWFRNSEGLNVHRSYGYLVNPVVAQIIADWWRQQDANSQLRGMRSRSAVIPEVVAHRGYPARYPENTILGYEQALAAGACYLECDVQFTSDLVPVLFHDEDLARTAQAEGLIHEKTLRELATIDVGEPSKFGERFRSTHIPTLALFADLVRRHSHVTAFIELKRASVSRFGAAPVVDRVLQDLEPVRDRIVLISFDYACLEYARQHYSVQIGWVLPAWSRACQTRARTLRPDYLFCDAEWLPIRKFALWRGNWRWAVYVVNDPKTVRKCTKLGIDLIETDVIGELLDDPVLRRRACRGSGGTLSAASTPMPVQKTVQ